MPILLSTVRKEWWYEPVRWQGSMKSSLWCIVWCTQQIVYDVVNFWNIASNRFNRFLRTMDFTPQNLQKTVGFITTAVKEAARWDSALVGQNSSPKGWLNHVETCCNPIMWWDVYHRFQRDFARIHRMSLDEIRSIGPTSNRWRIPDQTAAIGQFSSLAAGLLGWVRLGQSFLSKRRNSEIYSDTRMFDGWWVCRWLRVWKDGNTWWKYSYAFNI